MKYICLLFFILLSSLRAQSLNTQVQGILAEIPAGVNYSIFVLNPMTDDTIFAHNTQKLMIPASITKLYTTLSALTILGIDYRISTKLFTDDRELADGVINGNLYIKGYGNPLFDKAGINIFVNELKKRGIRKITGRIIGDDSYFDDEYVREDWIEEETTNYRLPPISALVYERNQIQVRKRVRKKRYRYVYQNVSNPPLNVAQILLKELKAEGITVGGKEAVGVTPHHAQELSDVSIQLRDLIKIINKRSDNFLAECLFKVIAAENSGEQGSAFNATQAVLSFMFSHDIIADGSKIVDGSGLSRYNQVTTSSVVSLLEWAYLNMDLFEDFQNSLSIAGLDGTLRRRMNESGNRIEFYGKTGTLSGLSSLAGYLKCNSGDDLIIAMIFEYEKGSSSLYKDIQDRIIELLAGYKSPAG